MSKKIGVLSPNVSLEISGGFGNQLFQLAAAEYLRSQGLSVYLDFSINQRNGVRDNLITDIASELNFSVHKLDPLQSFFSKIPILRRFLSNSIGIRLIKEAEEFLVPPVILTDQRLNYRGYWQNSGCATFIRDYVSNYFSVNKHKAVERIAVHVRRGDYLKGGNPNFHGVLSGDYYGTAIHSVRNKFGNLPVVVFTDSPELVSHETWISEISNLTVLDSKNPLDDFAEIAHSRAIVCSNSTFSWWASYISNCEIVILPSEWQVGLPLPEGLNQERAEIAKAYFIGRD